MLNHKEQTLYNKQKKQSNQYKLIVILFVSVVLLVYGYYVIVLGFVLLAYLSHEVLWSDHLFYNVRQDYQYNLKADFSETVDLSEHSLVWQERYNNKTLMLELDLISTVSGYFYDPLIELTTEDPGTKVQQQFFERKLQGKRFVNLSHINEQGVAAQISLSFKHCRLLDVQAKLHVFAHDDLNTEKILVIAPHADDAEIAAFGLYADHNSFIATLTAGEVEAGYYEAITHNKEAASLLKGRLRAWDSLKVPEWAGLKADEAIQLGYFCLTLKPMNNSPDKSVTSLTAGIADTRYFRAFNQIKLSSDEHGQANWNTLVQDLQEVIERVKPSLIVTAHPLLDPHSDHYYATRACLQACEKTGSQADFLLYANHYNHTDMHPLGLSGSLVSLAPEFHQSNTAQSLFSYKLDSNTQNDKRAALAMMHDLTTPLSTKKKLRQRLQQLFIHREKFQFGNDDYFRKAIRSNELFFKVNRQELQQLVDEK